MTALAEQHTLPARLSDATRLAILRLIRSENVGPITYHNLLSYYGSPEKALDAVPALAARGGKRKIRLCSEADARLEMEQVERFGAQMVMPGEAAYPSALSELPDAPPALSVLGDVSRFHNSPALAIIGARNASTNGCHFARRLANELGEQGYVIVSGLARGIDTHAHKASLESGTIAVIAGGINHIYPPENEALYQAISEQGAIITEAPFGTTPQARHFPARNRIIAGMTLGTIVVEATRKSGSLITANYALDYGRDVFAVPGSPMDPRAEGCNDLIKQGAQMVTSASDIVDALQSQQPRLAESKSPRFDAAPARLPDEQTLEKARTIVLGKLGPSAVLVDELLAECDITPHIMTMILLELELAGKLTRHAGGKVSLKY